MGQAKGLPKFYRRLVTRLKQAGLTHVEALHFARDTHARKGVVSLPTDRNGRAVLMDQLVHIATA